MDFRIALLLLIGIYSVPGEAPSTEEDTTHIQRIKRSPNYQRTRPAAPTGLTFENPTSTSITISWEKSDEYVVDKYIVECQKDNEKLSVIIEESTTNSLTFTGLEPSTRYYFKVLAQRYHLKSDWSLREIGQTLSPEENLQCNANQAYNRGSAACFVNTCMHSISGQIKMELNAAFSYLILAAYFDEVNNTQPGLAKFLYESASEERQHASGMLTYLGLRGHCIDSIDYKWEKDVENILTKDPNDSVYKVYQKTLEEALKMEKKVTLAIHKVIKECSKEEEGPDYHAADVFTNPILDEQFTGMRKLSGALSTLKDLGSDDFSLYIFDQKILKNGL